MLWNGTYVHRNVSLSKHREVVIQHGVDSIQWPSNYDVHWECAVVVFKISLNNFQHFRNKSHHFTLKIAAWCGCHVFICIWGLCPHPTPPTQVQHVPVGDIMRENNSCVDTRRKPSGQLQVTDNSPISKSTSCRGLEHGTWSLNLDAAFPYTITMSDELFWGKNL